MPEEYTELNKKQKLRHNEYYDTQEIYDNLYKESKEGKIFTKLYELVVDERNIKLAYRNIKKNKGSKTVGTNRSTIADIGKQDINRVVEYVRDRLRNFSPHSVRRKDIRKPNGKTDL